MSLPPQRSLQLIGPGRAGLSMATALERAGWAVRPPLGRGDDVRHAAADADLVIIATPDAAVAAVAAGVDPRPDTVVAHLSGALTLDVLAPHHRRGSIHPLRALPAPDTPFDGAWIAVAGDPVAAEVAGAIGGRAFTVEDESRAAYHAAAVMAANHLVALLGAVERVGATAGVPLDAYLDLAAGALDDVRRLGPAAALTGPVARGDWDTVARHLDAIPAAEAPLYRALSDAARELVGA